ncbi:Glycoside hydrolase [Parasponia andersonii]|uniref:Glycoside hydrolase n=1 Tax=Parasponia andersonii TaxID=3476 RepID=A0A2P5CAR2_PARAD|nr:Glycoside hydrolase [Parasponia andersonii]
MILAINLVEILHNCSLHIVRCENTSIHDVSIYGDFNTPNNDGIDIEDSNNTVITRCHIDTGDDAICPKTSTGPLYNLTATNCWIRTKSSAIKFGSASWFDFKGLVFDNITIVDSHRGLGFQIRDGGNVSDVTFSNINISTRYYDPSWWGRAEPIYVTTCPRESSSKEGSISNILFVNITANSENGIFLSGSKGGVLSNLRFINMNFTYRRWTKFAGGLVDYRPGCQGLINHSSAGILMEHIDGIEVENVNMRWFDDRSMQWNIPLDFRPATVFDTHLLLPNMLRKIVNSYWYPNHKLFSFIVSDPSTLQLSFLSSFPPISTYVKALCSNGRLSEALLQMSVQGLEVKFESYDNVLNECVSQRAVREGQRVHAHMIKTCYLPIVYLRTRLIILYAKCECLGDARKMLNEMTMRNVVSWTAMISAYSQRGHASEALNLFIQMLRSGTEPNEFTFATVLTSCTGPVGFELGRQIHSFILKRNFESHMFVGSSLLDMYAKAARIHEARGVFECLPERDVVSCTAIISGYAQLGFDEEALKLFRLLQREGMVPNYVTYASLLTALSGLAALDLGKQIHSHVLRFKLPSYVVLQNSFIDMYSKCGKLTYSRRIFDSMTERTVISWNAMIVGYSKHGMGREVVELFNLMKEDNKVKPDSVTFLAVLSGCSHGGMEDKGLEIFYEMNKGKDETKPEMVHYGCVVDLLGRSGRVDEAFEFINKMPLEPTAALWGSLLGACRVHSNVDIGEFAGRRLLEIEPENAGNYVNLSNIYASAGRWEDVRIIRELMKDKVVIKEPGRSWVEIDQILHTFHASDRSHPRREEVKMMLNELSVKFKEVGYVPDLTCVLFDVDEEQKEKILLNHSEKLALAFGLIATSEGMPIRVIKNLRICVDCHNFAKIFSKVYGREVSLRDKTRFHRIVGGICSCRDYW